MGDFVSSRIKEFTEAGVSLMISVITTFERSFLCCWIISLRRLSSGCSDAYSAIVLERVRLFSGRNQHTRSGMEDGKNSAILLTFIPNIVIPTISSKCFYTFLALNAGTNKDIRWLCL